MPIVRQANGEENYYLFYSSRDFVSGLVVTGKIFYGEGQTLPVTEFSDLGEGIYGATITAQQEVVFNVGLQLILIKENGIPKLFDPITVIK